MAPDGEHSASRAAPQTRPGLCYNCSCGFATMGCVSRWPALPSTLCLSSAQLAFSTVLDRSFSTTCKRTLCRWPPSRGALHHRAPCRQVHPPPLLLLRDRCLGLDGLLGGRPWATERSSGSAETGEYRARTLRALSKLAPHAINGGDQPWAGVLLNPHEGIVLCRGHSSPQRFSVSSPFNASRLV